MSDVIVVGAGPAGALSALLLARAGARVRLIDRARFPRDKLCGDTLNPGALRVLARHVDIAPLVARSLAIDGMRLTGPSGVSVSGRYGHGLVGRSITRRELDAWLLAQAVAAGVRFDDGVTVTKPVMDTRGDSTRIAGVRIRSSRGATDVIHAPMVIGADGRRSLLAASIQVARQPQRPRRWAVGAYFEDVEGLQALGEMHVRHGRYIGVAPLPDGRANACLVESWHPVKGCPPSTTVSRNIWRDPGGRLRDALMSDPLLSSRFARARAVTPPVVLGPMAVDVSRPGALGLLLAGDAAGFIDPMTGDGLRYAFVGAELAAAVAAGVLAGDIAPDRAPDVLASRRRARLSAKWRFNRALRQIVSWPIAISAATVLARISEGPFEAIIRYAGDCHVQ